MNNFTYQNIDIPENNPTKVNQPIKFKLPKNKKTILLGSLGLLIIILLIISTLVPRPKSNISNTTIQPITPIPSANINQTNPIPTQFEQKFNQIEQKLNYKQDLLPPTIDLDMGLK